jgi:hypothetical protein
MDLASEQRRWISFDLTSLTNAGTPMHAATQSPRSSTISYTGPERTGFSRSLLVVCSLLTALGTSGCMSARLEELRHAPTRLQAGESVVLLSRTHLDGKGVEPSFLSCLNRRLSGAALAEVPLDEAMISPSLQPRSGANATVVAKRFGLFPQRQFVDAFYPWLEPSSAPTDGAGLEKFLSRPGVRERVTSMGVRYIVWVDGATQKVDGGGNITCGIFGGGAGCFGVAWWQKKSTYEATVWDLDGGIGAGNVSTSVNGFSVFLGFGVPVPLIAPVQGTACRRLSSQLEAFLRNETYR